MSTDNTQPKVIAESPIDINNPGPNRVFANDPDYASLVWELYRTGWHVAESDGKITLVGRICELRQETRYDEETHEYETFFPPLAVRFMSDLTMVKETDLLAIDINVYRVLQWRDHAKFAHRLDLALWSDLIVLSRIAPDGEVSRGTYHFCTIA